MKTTTGTTAWLTRAETMTAAGISARTLTRWFAEGKLTKHTDGAGRVRVSSVELADVLTPVPAVRTA